MIIIINDMEILVTKKAIKNMHLYVKPPDGHVIVSAPLTLSDENIKTFVNSKMNWIKQQKHRISQQHSEADIQFVSGETIFIWGNKYTLNVSYNNSRNSFLIQNDQVFLNVRKESTKDQRIKYINECYRDILKTEIKRVLPKWEQITGLCCNTWQIKNMSTRWGTCNVKTKKIWLNLQLAKKTPECLEYIILHELAHLKKSNHGKRFKDILDKYMPNWREIKNRLNG